MSTQIFSFQHRGETKAVVEKVIVPFHRKRKNGDAAYAAHVYHNNHFIGMVVQSLKNQKWMASWNAITGDHSKYTYDDKESAVIKLIEDHLRLDGGK